MKNTKCCYCIDCDLIYSSNNFLLGSIKIVVIENIVFRWWNESTIRLRKFSIKGMWVLIGSFSLFFSFYWLYFHNGTHVALANLQGNIYTNPQKTSACLMTLIHRSSRLHSLMSVEESWLIFEHVLVQSLLNMCLLWCLLFDPPKPHANQI